jgi:hypothetical protein
MDATVYEALQKVTPLTQPTAATMDLKAAVECLAHQLDEALTRIAILEAVQDAPKSVTPLLNTAEVSEVLRHTIVGEQR